MATGEVVGVTGRVMLYRTGGKLCFATIREGTDDIQVMVSRDRVGEEAPTLMTDGEPADFIPVATGVDPADPVDSSIVNTCRATFAWHGLKPPM